MVLRRVLKPKSTRIKRRPSDDDDEGQDGAIAVRVKTDVKTRAETEELREPPGPLKMQKRARLMKMETEETVVDVAGA